MLYLSNAGKTKTKTNQGTIELMKKGLPNHIKFDEQLFGVAKSLGEWVRVTNLEKSLTMKV